MAPVAGRFLLASPSMLDPNFRLSVVWVLDHDDGGAFGVVLNRPSELGVAEALPQWSTTVSRPRQLFVGGPVGSDSAFAVARPAADRLGLHVGLRSVSLGLCVLDLDADPADLGDAVEAVRVYVGYAGWGPGQLDDELEHDAWVVVDGIADDVFSSSPGALWHQLMQRAGGGLARFANFPEAPWLN